MSPFRIVAPISFAKLYMYMYGALFKTVSRNHKAIIDLDNS